MQDPRLDEHRWRPHVEDIALACLSRHPDEDAALITAIGLRETWLGTCGKTFVVPPGRPDYMGRGDYGHGWGYWQIDDRGPFKYLLPKPGQDWPVFIQAQCACIVVADARQSLAIMRANLSDWQFDQAICATYNSGAGNVLWCLRQGLDPDRVTAKGRDGVKNYGRDVLSIRDSLRKLYPSVFPPVHGTPSPVGIPQV